MVLRNPFQIHLLLLCRLEYRCERNRLDGKIAKTRVISFEKRGRICRLIFSRIGNFDAQVFA